MISIGYAGEQYARSPVIDISEYLARWPDSIPQLIVQRPTEHEAYIATISFQRDRGTVIWEVNAYDTALEGRGKAQLVFIKSNTDKTIVGKSPVIPITIQRSIEGTADAQIPDPYEAWVATIAKYAEEATVCADEASNYAKTASESAINAQSAAGQYPFIGNNGNWFVWDVSVGAFVDTELPAQGPAGRTQDISGKADKVSDAVTGNFPALDAEGNLTDSGHKHSDYLTSHQDISGKADKVADAVTGNFPALDAEGNLTDSGHKHSDYLISHQDISGKADKVQDAVSGNFPALDANGNLIDSGHKHSDYLTSHQDISGKADKVQDAVSGNFPALDANGNLMDSGHKHSDYLTRHQDISGKADKVQDAVSGNFPALDANGNLMDSGHKHSDYLTSHQDISGKADKVADAVTGNFSALDAEGNLTDSGHKHSDYLTSHQDISGKVDKVADAVTGNFPALDAQGNLMDSGHKHSDYLTSHQDISRKADKVVGAVTGNFPVLDTNGNLVDSGHKHSDYLTSHQDISGKADKVTDAVTGNFPALDAQGNLRDSGHKHSDYLTRHQDISGKADKVVGAVTGNFPALDAEGNLTDSGHKHSDYLTEHQSLNGYVQNTDYATESVGGVVKVLPANGIYLDTNKQLAINYPTDSQMKTGSAYFRPIVPALQHKSVFYGLAKAAGDTSQQASSNEVGEYTDAAQNAIQAMLGVEPGVFFVENVSGSTVTITGEAGVRYICGEVAEITVTPPASGTIDVFFFSGTTPALLTLPDTVRFPEWVDLSVLDESTTYEIMITDAIYGSVMTWAE